MISDNDLISGSLVVSKSPCPTMGQGRVRGTTLHYTYGLSVTGTSALTYYLRPRSSRVMDRRSFAPAFTKRRLSEASNQLSSRSQHVLHLNMGLVYRTRGLLSIAFWGEGMLAASEEGGVRSGGAPHNS